MSFRRAEFVQIIADILTRYGRQNSMTVPAREALTGIGDRLWQLIETRGLPAPLAPSDMGTPGEVGGDEIAPLMLAALGENAGLHPLATPVRQLLKACFHPNFNKCRDSYHEVDSDGTCRRQQLERALVRVSGSHCVDCPYWTALSVGQHESCLRDHWCGSEAEFSAHKTVFLPQDFRALRLLLRDCARRKGKST